ncbi:MAG: tol-pal system-associated acyl-CoA thioesterase [Gammaproteobacteria bacterium]
MNEFLWPVRVYYEDTDAGGVVYYANYLKFMERARTEWLRQLGVEQDELRQQHNVVFVVSAVHMRYLAPARFNEQLLVVSKIKHVGKVRLCFTQEILRAEDRRPLCRGEVDVACLDMERQRPVALPAIITAQLLTGD